MQGGGGRLDYHTYGEVATEAMSDVLFKNVVLHLGNGHVRGSGSPAQTVMPGGIMFLYPDAPCLRA